MITVQNQVESKRDVLLNKKKKKQICILKLVDTINGI